MESKRDVVEVAKLRLNLSVPRRSEIEIIDVSYYLHFCRYTSKGASVYAILTARPPKSVVQLLIPKTSTATKVKALRWCLCCFYR